MLAVSAQAKKAMIDDLGSAAFMVDLASMERETQYLGRAIWPLLLSPERFCSTCFNPCQRLSHCRGESRMVIDIIVS